MRTIYEIKADLEDCENCVYGHSCLFLMSNCPKPYNHEYYISEFLKAITEGMRPDRLQEICEAERDGRLVVLPCKVGDSLYADDTSKIGKIMSIDIFLNELTINKSPTINPRFSLRTVDYNNGQHLVHKINSREIGKTVFLTREEAEAKLKELEEITK